MKKINGVDWRSIIRDYFTFSRKDRIGILVLLAMIFLVAFLPRIRGGRPTIRVADSTWTAALNKLNARDSGNAGQFNSANDKWNEPIDHQKVSLKNDPKPVHLFFFDPNRLDVAGWRSLGLPDRNIRTIQNYVARGGRFKKPDDLQKIYGLSNELYFQLAPYIRIAIEVQPKERPSLRDNPPQTKKIFQHQMAAYQSIEINATDTTALIALPGIGSKLAARIIRFRDQLGGFYFVEQVGETFGLADSTFNKIKKYLRLDTSFIKKININSASLEDLKAHPYIRWKIANAIISYRNEHGPFLTLEDIKKMMVVTEDIYFKMLPYLTIQ